MRAKPWLVWPHGLGIVPQMERLPVWLLVRAHGTGLGCGPEARLWARSPVMDGRKATDPYFSPSLSPRLPFSLKINKILKMRANTWNRCLEVRGRCDRRRHQQFRLHGQGFISQSASCERHTNTCVIGVIILSFLCPKYFIKYLKKSEEETIQQN